MMKFRLLPKHPSNFHKLTTINLLASIKRYIYFELKLIAISSVSFKTLKSIVSNNNDGANKQMLELLKFI